MRMGSELNFFSSHQKKKDPPPPVIKRSKEPHIDQINQVIYTSEDKILYIVYTMETAVD
jgi:hypothetical protein